MIVGGVQGRIRGVAIAFAISITMVCITLLLVGYCDSMFHGPLR